MQTTESGKGGHRDPSAKLDDLPEHIIHHIQSILGLKDAVRTSILSKTWQKAFSAIPTLRFNQLWYGSEKNLEADGSNEIPSKFEKFVGDTLVRYAQNNLLIESFDLLMENVDENQRVASLVQEWLQVVFATKNRLKKLSLDLDFENRSEEQLLYFPPSEMINCCFLQVLFLSYVHIDEQVLHKLFSTSILMEEIKIEFCDGFKKVQLRSLPRLRSFFIRLLPNQIVEIEDTPCLNSLVWNNSYHEFELGKPSASLKIAAAKNLRYLKLILVNLPSEQFNKFIAEFPYLEFLYIESNEILEKINISCKSLSELRIASCGKLKDVKVHSPKLLRFRGYNLPALFFPSITHNQLDASLHGNSYFLRLREVGISYELEIAFKEVRTYGLDIVPNALGEISIPSNDVEELLINLDYYSFDRQSLLQEKYFPTIMDAVFSICHPKYVVTIWDLWGRNVPFCKYLLRELMERRNSISCCGASDQNKCWHHYLKDVEIGSRRKLADKTLDCDKSELEPLPFTWKSLLDGSKTFVNGSLIFKLKWEASLDAK